MPENDLVTWMVETGLDEESENRLLASLEQLDGVEVQIRKEIPFGQGLVRGPKNSYAVGPVIYHGSISGARWVQENTDWMPGAIANTPAYRCRSYYPVLAEFLLNRRHLFLPFASLEVMKDDLFDWLGEDDCIFVRPDSNNKPFTGQLVKRESWDEDMELVGFYDAVTPDLMVVVAPPQNISEEWRFFIRGPDVLTGSQYRQGPHTMRHKRVRPGDNDLGWSLAQHVANHAVDVGWSPDPIWVLDICRDKQGLLRVLEVGSFSCAGLYAADTDILAAAATEVARG